MGGKERRRTLIVDKEAQKRIVLSVALFPALALAMATMIIAIFCRRLVGEAMRADVSLPSLVPLLLATLGFALASTLIILNQAVRFSHRVVGPGYRLRKAFQQVKEGDLQTRIRLRRGDHLTEVADSFNELLEWLREHPPAGVDLKTSQDEEAPAKREPEHRAAELPVGAPH
jgi:methyl-accepting chemotaxis protein